MIVIFVSIWLWAYRALFMLILCPYFFLNFSVFCSVSLMLCYVMFVNTIFWLLFFFLVKDILLSYCIYSKEAKSEAICVVPFPQNLIIVGQEPVPQWQKTTDHTLFVHPFDSKDMKANVSLKKTAACWKAVYCFITFNEPMTKRQDSNHAEASPCAHVVSHRSVCVLVVAISTSV